MRPQPSPPRRNGAAPLRASWASILLGSSVTAQGPIIARHRGGRVTISAGGRHVTGVPLNA